MSSPYAIHFAVTPFDRGAHVSMVRESGIEIHDLASIACWCGPKLLAPCDECGIRGCWKCENGWRPLTVDEACDDDGPFVVVHNG